MLGTRHIWKTYELVEKWGRVGRGNRVAGKFTGSKLQRQAALRRTNLLFPPSNPIEHQIKGLLPE